MHKSFLCPPHWGLGYQGHSGVKCRDLTNDGSPQCGGCAGILISRLNRRKKNNGDIRVLLIGVPIYLQFIHLYVKVLI